MIPAMEFASRLGARYMLCTSVLVSEYDAREEPRTMENLAQLCEVGAPLGIRPMLEFMIYRSVGTLADAVRMVDRVRHPNLGICVDALHLSRSGGSPESLRNVDPGLLGYAQICDAPGTLPPAAQIPLEARSDRLDPGEGPLAAGRAAGRPAAGHPRSVEAPSLRVAHLSCVQRAQAAARSTRALLRQHAPRRPRDA